MYTIWWFRQTKLQNLLFLISYIFSTYTRMVVTDLNGSLVRIAPGFESTTTIIPTHPNFGTIAEAYELGNYYRNPRCRLSTIIERRVYHLLKKKIAVLADVTGNEVLNNIDWEDRSLNNFKSVLLNSLTSEVFILIVKTSKKYSWYTKQKKYFESALPGTSVPEYVRASVSPWQKPHVKKPIRVQEFTATKI